MPTTAYVEIFFPEITVRSLIYAFLLKVHDINIMAFIHLYKNFMLSKNIMQSLLLWFESEMLQGKLNNEQFKLISFFAKYRVHTYHSIVENK